ncbi:hypothetical protein ACELLULO517_24155 [Acidisoma cellulosilytica]|uniref:Uncharacterized protein n=1 Tax=Acidisoma cellulosilyticum TaxID=2802395 RepID=A0A963Z674_9PROT|nr:hypothetical protein [Acidisoma cellulosilyticum]MCB8883363.1 hypothetical protein [Acidisoma cellulosilyticum]
MHADLDSFYRGSGDLTGQLDLAFQEALANRYRGAEADCLFSHTLNLADGRSLQGATDLRGTEAAHLGDCDITGQRVLEFGGGSGWLTQYMASRAGELVTLDIPVGREELSAPLAAISNPHGLDGLRDIQERIRRGWWFVKDRAGHPGKMVYCDLHNPPSDLGRFEVSVLPSTLLQVPMPFLVVQAAARVTERCIVITEPVVATLSQDGNGLGPAALFAPNIGTGQPNHWWQHSAAALARMLMVAGFGDLSLSVSVAEHSAMPLLTVSGRRPSD